MFFEPRHSLLRHVLNSEALAHRWLKAIQGPRFEDLRPTLRFETMPERNLWGTDQPPLANGPVLPIAQCPQTGRPLHLHYFHDLSCVLIREGDSFWEALPAVMTLPSETLDTRIQSEDPFSPAPRLRLQPRTEGLFWSIIDHSKMPGMALESSNEAIRDILVANMEEAAEDILSAPPVADPRVHERPPSGSRFAPFSLWPSLEDYPCAHARLEAGVRALVALHARTHGMKQVSVIIQRHSPRTPWRQGSRTNQTVALPDRAGIASALRELLLAPELGFPESLLCGPDREILFKDTSLPAAGSAHEKLQAHQTLSSLLGERARAFL